MPATSPEASFASTPAGTSKPFPGASNPVPRRSPVLGHWRTVLVAGGIAIGVNGTAGVAQWFGVYLAGNRGLPTATVLIAYATAMVFGALWVPLAGALTDRFGQRRMLTVVLTLFIAGSVPIFWLLSETEHPVLLFAGMGTYLVLTNMIMAPGFGFIAELFPPAIRYTASNFGQNIGTVLGGGTAPLVCGALLLATESDVGPILWIVGMGLIGLGAVAAAHRVANNPRVAAPAPTDRRTDPLPEST
ncbi:MFS transporter [Nocardia rhamnosiphila]